MTDLSPAAQAVEDAYFNADGFGYRKGIAAALRAAVDQVLPEAEVNDFSPGVLPQAYAQQRHVTRLEFLAIAQELENAND